MMSPLILQDEALRLLGHTDLKGAKLRRHRAKLKKAMKKEGAEISYPLGSYSTSYRLKDVEKLMRKTTTVAA